MNENDEDVLYECNLATDYYLEISIIRTDLKGLKELEEEIPIIDFSIDSGYLKCRPDIERVLVNPMVFESQGKEIYFTKKESTLCDLITEGVLNDFILFDSDVIEKDDFRLQTKGTGIVPFYKIKISKSTMSVYTKMTVKEGIYNRMLVKPVNGKLELVPFYFGVPIDKTFSEVHCKFIKKIEYNGIFYNIWSASELALYSDFELISDSLINRAVHDLELCQSLQNAYSELSSLLWSLMSDKNEKSQDLNWIGGSSSYQSHLGTYFVCNVDHLSKDDAAHLINNILKVISEGMDIQEKAFKYIQSKNNLNHFAKFTALKLFDFIYKNLNRESDLDILSSEDIAVLAYEEEKEWEALALLCSVFLYRIRVYVYLYHHSLCRYPNIYLTGGAVSTYTIVKEGFFYGD